MGCDIHGYIEYEDWEDNGKPHHSCFGENLGDRDYAMFGLLAGVRRGSAIFSPRGIPENISYTVKSSFYMFVVDDEMNGERCVSRTLAREWIDKGWSKKIDENYISDPDWHTPSWLTAKEYEQVLQAREEMKDYGNVDQEWYAILAAMKALKNARFVFWFDN
jgi:hypothetical protein